MNTQQITTPGDLYAELVKVTTSAEPSGQA